MKDNFERLKAIVNAELNRTVIFEIFPTGLDRAMSYSLLSGGKRLRGLLLLAFAELCGASSDEPVSDFAAAVEMLHTYSLVHDDLPCMDDDDERRGMPSCHKKFGEAIAVLTGDALQSLAFSVMSAAALKLEEPVRGIKAMHILADAAGVGGMCSGQALDMSGGDMTELQFMWMVSCKTADLFSAACEMGAVLGGAGEAEQAAAKQFGHSLGYLFQATDDLLDAQADDAASKQTYLTRLGEEGCRSFIREAAKECKNALSLFENTEFLAWLVDSITERAE